MTASANYGVSIAEDFTPPENWVPGQTIDKNVGVVNTGNVDAFVRTWLEGEMKILNQTSTATAAWDGTKFVIDGNDIATVYFNKATGSNIGDATDEKFIDLNLTKKHTDNSDVTTYFKMLDKIAVDNPKNSSVSGNQSANPANDTRYSEVQSVQAGGILAYAPDNAEYEYYLNQATEMEVVTDTTTSPVTTTMVTVPKGTRVVVAVATKASTPATDGRTIATYAGTTGGVNTVYVPVQASAASFKPVNVDTETFKPLTPGLYLFARNKETSATNPIAPDYEFSGYYYSDYSTVEATPTTFTHVAKQTKDNTSNTAIVKGDFGEGTYYALRYEQDDANRSDYTVSSTNYTTAAPASPATELVSKIDEGTGELLLVAPTGNLALFTASETVVDRDTIVWAFDSANNKITARYADQNVSSTKDDIIVDIALSNLGTTGQTWKAIEKTGYLTGFYYNDDLEAGDTTAKLVDSVTLNKDVTEKAFMAFDFDLIVKSDSVQVTMAENGNETTVPVEGTSGQFASESTGGVAGATATAQSAAEIADIAWAGIS